jgi:hypothetical protein
MRKGLDISSLVYAAQPVRAVQSRRPGEHACANKTSGASTFGFAALSEHQLQMTLQEWAAQFPDATFGEITVALPAEAQDEDSSGF